VPIRETKIPVNFRKFSFSLKNKFENKARKIELRATIIEALLAVVYFRPEKKQILSPAIPTIPKRIIIFN